MATPYGQRAAEATGSTGTYTQGMRQQRAAVAAIKPKGRGGTSPAAGAFNTAHPRTAKGRVGGGEFAKKQQTQAQARKQRAQRPPTTSEMLASAKVQSVAEFQKTRGLPVTGKLDQRTVVALRNAHTAAQVDAQAAALKGSAKASARASAAKPGVVKLGKNEYAKIGMGTKDHPDSRVKNIQQMLEHLGYDVAVDGVFGPETEAAVRLFQRGYGLPPTGVVTVHSMRRINRRQAEVDSGKSRTGFLSADEPATRKGGKPIGGRGSTGKVSTKTAPKLRTTTVIMQADDAPEPSPAEPSVHPDRVVVDGEEIVGPDVTTLPWWDEVEPITEAVHLPHFDKLLHPHDRRGQWARTYAQPRAQARADKPKGGPLTVHLMGEDRPVDLAEVHGMPTTTRVFGAFAAGMPLGLLTVDTKRGTVELVHVDRHVRRQGIASKLLAVARHETGLPLAHDTGDRSESGTAFARAAGLKRGKGGRDLPQREADAMGARMMVAVYGDDVQFTRASDGSEPDTRASAQQYVASGPLAYQSREIGNRRTREVRPPPDMATGVQLADALAAGMAPGRETTSIYEVAQHMATAHRWPSLPENLRLIEQAEVGGNDPTGGVLGELRATSGEHDPTEWTVSVRSQALDDGYGGVIFAHEMGHVLDSALAHERLAYMPLPGVLMISQVAAAEPTGIDDKLIRPEQRMAWRRFFKTAHTASVAFHPSDPTYTASPHELWARAYAQWLGTTMGETLRDEFERQTGAVHRWPPQEWEPVGKAVESVLRAHHLLPTAPEHRWKVGTAKPVAIQRVPIMRGAPNAEDWTDEARDIVNRLVHTIAADDDPADALEAEGFHRDSDDTATTHEWSLDTDGGIVYATHTEGTPDDLEFEWHAFDRPYHYQPKPIFWHPLGQPSYRKFGNRTGLSEADVPVAVSRAAEKLLGLVGRRLNGEPVTDYDREVQMTGSV